MGPGMGMQMGLRTEQKMQLVLAPRMIQSMEILQLPIMALQERIQQELQENPVLELQEDAREDGTVADEPEAEGLDAVPANDREDVSDPQKELVIDDKGDNELDFDRLEAI